MHDRESLIFPVSLKNNSPIVRRYLFELLASKFGTSGPGFWSCNDEGQDRDFIKLLSDIQNLDIHDLSKYEHIQDRAISTLARLTIKFGPAADRIRDIASAFLDFPGVKNESVKAMEETIQRISLKYDSKVFSIQPT